MEHQRERIMELHEDLRERLHEEKNNNNDANVPDDDHGDGTWETAKPLTGGCTDAIPLSPQNNIPHPKFTGDENNKQSLRNTLH